MSKDNWIKTRLIDISDKEQKNSFIDGDWIETPHIKENGVRLIQTGNIGRGVFRDNSKKYISEESFELLKCKEVFKGDILICRLADPIGRSCIVPQLNTRNITSVDVTIFRVNEKKYNTLFISHLINTDSFLQKANEVAGGSTRQRISRSKLGNLNLLVPSSLDTQRHIAEILTTTDTLITQTESVIAKYKSIKQGMLHDLFTRGIDVSTGKLRPTPQQAPHLYKESVLGLIPKEWEVKRLEEITTQIGDGIHTTPIYSESTNFYFINGNNLDNGDINLKNALCVNEDEYKAHYKALNERTILYSINGTIGNVAIYKNEKVILGKSACFISCKNDVSLDYVYFILQTSKIKQFYELEMTGSTIKNLSLQSVRNTPIVIPKESIEQNIISERIISLNDKIKFEESVLAKYQSIKKGLMKRLLEPEEEA